MPQDDIALLKLYSPGTHIGGRGNKQKMQNKKIPIGMFLSEIYFGFLFFIRPRLTPRPCRWMLLELFRTLQRPQWFACQSQRLLSCL